MLRGCARTALPQRSWAAVSCADERPHPTSPCACPGESVDLYIPRKCSWTNRLITAKDHASIQINIGHLDETGVYTGQYTTLALSGFVRTMVRPLAARTARGSLAAASDGSRGLLPGPRVGLSFATNARSSPHADHTLRFHQPGRRRQRRRQAVGGEAGCCAPGFLERWPLAAPPTPSAQGFLLAVRAGNLVAWDAEEAAPPAARALLLKHTHDLVFIPSASKPARLLPLLYAKCLTAETRWGNLGTQHSSLPRLQGCLVDGVLLFPPARHACSPSARATMPRDMTGASVVAMSRHAVPAA